VLMVHLQNVRTHDNPDRRGRIAKTAAGFGG
jgi:hypothetical protein